MLTVTTPATEFRMVPVSVVEAALGVTDDTANMDALLKRASDVIARHCRRVFALEMVTEQFRQETLQQELILARYPVTAITSIVENGVTLTEGTDYEVDKAKGFVTRLYNDRPCWWSICKTVVVYSAGYDLPTGAPGSLAQACVQLVKAYYIGGERDPMMRSETVDQLSGATFFDADLPPDVRGLLTQFRNFRVRS